MSLYECHAYGCRLAEHSDDGARVRARCQVCGAWWSWASERGLRRKVWPGPGGVDAARVEESLKGVVRSSVDTSTPTPEEAP